MKKSILKHFIFAGIFIGSVLYTMNNEYFKYRCLDYFRSKDKKIDSKSSSVKDYDSSLYGRKFSGLYADYFGLDTIGYRVDRNGFFIFHNDSKIPEREILNKKMKIDFESILVGLHNKKFNRFTNDKLLEFNKTIKDRYCSASSTKMTLEDYIFEANCSVDVVNDNLDWKAVGKRMGLDSLETIVVENVSRRIDGADLISYSLTELFPKKNGSFNSDFLDLLLKTAGREYVELLPALYDKYISFGPYQFTEYAVYDSPKERRGASIINRALPEVVRIPGSVSELKHNDHFKAAYLFAIYNLSLVVKDRRIDDSSLHFLNNSSNDEYVHNQIMKYIATAHYKPTNVRTAFCKWLDGGCVKSFNKYCDNRIKMYADKTDLNIISLFKYKNFESNFNLALAE